MLIAPPEETAAAAASFRPVLEAATGYWATAAIRAAVELDLFSLIDRRELSAEEISEERSLHPRGARGLLDSLAGIGLLEVRNRRFRNSPTALRYLRTQSPDYMADTIFFVSDPMPEWMTLAGVVESGEPVKKLHSVPDHPYWDRLVKGIAKLTEPVAAQVAQMPEIANGAVSALDIGGGGGMFCSAFLRANPQLQATQIDWSNVNAIAREAIAKEGNGSRFRTIDGDFRTLDFGDAQYDAIVYSHVAHGFDIEDNLATLAKIHRALKPGGILLINEYLVSEDGSADPWVLLFSSNILFHSPHGSGWREDEYRDWLREAGFDYCEVRSTTTPASLIVARR